MEALIQVLLTLLILVPGAQIVEGKATRYDPGIMDQVVENRIKWDQIDITQLNKGYVALASCEWLNSLVVLEIPDRQRLVGPLLVVDCGAAGDQEHLRRIDFAVDLSWELAELLGGIDAPIQEVIVYEWEGVSSISVK